MLIRRGLATRPIHRWTAWRCSTVYFSLLVTLWQFMGCSRNIPEPKDHPSSRQQTTSQTTKPTLRFANMAADVQYVGNQACIHCHAEQNQSYEQTAHRHALAEIDLSQEPAPGSYDHPVSGRAYEVIHDREHQRLVHREKRIGSPSNSLSQEHSIRYVIGSGHHSRSYLIEIDDYLIESPITWYTRQSAYAMSPGYDRKAHGSFERIADFNCLVCHAGEVSTSGGNSFKPVVRQQTIGCESCHGPGALHVTKHHEKAHGSSLQEDQTIVNPSRLSREESESICANCHLRGVAAVTLPGKTIASFRPGMRLQDCRVDYQLASADSSMTVVGHVEQMHLSACYIKSETMTCTTCHDPHLMVPAAQRKQHFIEKCIECHQAGCPSSQAERLQKVPDNNCMTCHMPQSPTDIPHFAFTHHRIGHHSADSADKASQTQSAATAPAKVGSLVRILGTKLSPALERRNEGLAYFELGDLEKSPDLGQQYLARAESLLLETYNSPLRDPEVESALARLSWERQDYSSALQLAESALRHPAISSRARLNSLFIIGESYLQLQDYPKATQALEALVKDRRIYADWLLLTLCYSRTGRLDQAERCLQQAIKISPFRREAHEMIIEVYKRQNKPELVHKHSTQLADAP